MNIFDSIYDAISSIAQAYYMSTLYAYNFNRGTRSKFYGSLVLCIFIHKITASIFILLFLGDT